MTLIEDFRDKKDGEEEETTEEVTKDAAALEMKGVNPLAEEESVEEDDSAGD